jgi:hypothetical protein
LQAAGEGHGGRERELMAGREVDEADAAAGQAANRDAFLVDSGRADRGAARCEGVDRTGISGVLHRHAVAGIQEQARRS